MCLMATPNGEVTQTLASATSKRGLNKEVRLHCLGKGPGLNALRTIKEVSDLIWTHPASSNEWKTARDKL